MTYARKKAIDAQHDWIKGGVDNSVTAIENLIASVIEDCAQEAYPAAPHYMSEGTAATIAKRIRALNAPTSDNQERP